MNCVAEIWVFNGKSMLLQKFDYLESYQWGCIEIQLDGQVDALIAVAEYTNSNLELVLDRKRIKEINRFQNDNQTIITYYCLVSASCNIRIRNNDDKAIYKWRSIQEIESIHFDEEFRQDHFEKYIKFVRKHVFKIYWNRKGDAIGRVIKINKDIVKPNRGLPSLGVQYLKGETGIDKEIFDAFQVYGDALYTMHTILPEKVNNSLGTGNPIETSIFPPIKHAIEVSLSTKDYCRYPMPAGDIKSRRIICEYLKREGFPDEITPENIIFTASTTHAYSLILQTILRPGDVVVFSAPTYGLFVFEAKRLGARVEFVELRPENDWLIDPEDLQNVIRRTNDLLSSDTENGFTPKVTAFLNINPHNPMGKIMGEDRRDVIEGITNVCREYGVFIIDDLIYKDLCFDMSNKPLPVSAMDANMQNCISLLGLSKSYGAAGLRAGMVVADETIIRAIRSRIFQSIDSVSELAAKAMAAAFNCTRERNDQYKAYFSFLTDEYYFRFNLMRAGIEGLSSIDAKYIGRVEREVNVVLGKTEAQKWLLGIPGIKLVERADPEAGFFCLVNFNFVKGKRNGNWQIYDEESLLRFLFHKYRINFIIGRAIAWPKKEDLIARFSFSVDCEKIISVLKYIGEEISGLK